MNKRGAKPLTYGIQPKAYIYEAILDAMERMDLTLLDNERLLKDFVANMGKLTAYILQVDLERGVNTNFQKILEDVPRET